MRGLIKPRSIMETEETLTQALPESAKDAPTPAMVRPARWKILAEFFLFAVIFATDPYVQVISTVSFGRVEMSLTNLHSNPPPLALLAVLLLWLNGGLSSLNFRWPANWKRCLWQLGVVLVLGFLATELFARITQALWGEAPQATQMKRMIGHPEVKYVFLFLVFPIWAVAEEVLYRAYFLQRIESLAKPCVLRCLWPSSVHRPCLRSGT